MKFTLLSTLAAALAATTVLAEPIRPDLDDWYSPPKGYEDKKNGEVIQLRKVPNPIQKVENLGSAYQLMYRTTDSHGDPMAAVTTLLVPSEGLKSDRLVSYQVAEDASWIGCAPSYTLQTDGVDGSIQSLLDAGYIVNSPDYQGPNSAFTAGILAGQLTLDSLRAALASSDTTGVDSSAKISMWGYSGGSVPTGWAAELQPDYAPELKISGAAYGGYVCNITAVALHCDGGFTSGFIPGGIIGLANEYPEINKTVEAQLIPSKADKFKSAQTQCVTQNLLGFPLQKIFKTYFQDGEDLLYEDDVQRVMNDQTQGKSAPKVPLFIYQGADDEVVPIDAVESTVENYCADGANLMYNVLPGGDHMGTSTDGTEPALEFLDSVMDGKISYNGCTSKTGELTTTGTKTNSETKTGKSTKQESSAAAASSSEVSVSATDGGSKTKTASSSKVSTTGTASSTGFSKSTGIYGNSTAPGTTQPPASSSTHNGVATALSSGDTSGAISSYVESFVSTIQGKTVTGDCHVCAGNGGASETAKNTPAATLSAPIAASTSTGSSSECETCESGDGSANNSESGSSSGSGSNSDSGSGSGSDSNSDSNVGEAEESAASTEGANGEPVTSSSSPSMEQTNSASVITTSVSALGVSTLIIMALLF